MRPLQSWFDEYAENHQNKTNKAIHWICVPLIFYSLIGLLASIRAPFLEVVLPDKYAHWGMVLVIGGLIFYLLHSVRMAIGIALFCVLCLYFAELMRSLSLPLWQSSLLIFAAAWIGQFYGHKVEGKKPSFFKDVQFLLIGPAWLLSFIYKKLGIGY